MTALAIVAQAWEHKILILCALLVGMVALHGHDRDTIKALRKELAARPTVNDLLEKKSQTRTEKGRTKTTTTFAPSDKCEPVIVTQVVETEPEVIVKTVEVEKSHTEIPTCPAAPRDPKFLLGGFTQYDPGSRVQVEGISIGYSPSRHIDLSIGTTINGPTRHEARAELRF